jgi:site-specific DNA recombinase
MSPTHSNKLGVRYRYYVSHALLQNRKEQAGSVARVPAPEIEQLVLEGIRARVETTKPLSAAADCDLIECHVDRVIVRPQAVEVRLMSGNLTESADLGSGEPPPGKPTTLTLPWAAPSFEAMKGIVHEPAAKPAMSPESRDALLAAVAKARIWIEDLRLGRVATLTEIAERERLGARHVRLLAPLAFVAPRVVRVIADGDAPAHLNITGLAKALPYSWAEQEKRAIVPASSRSQSEGRRAKSSPRADST